MPKISKEDVLSVAKDINVKLSDEQVDQIVNEYYPRQHNDNWTQDVEEAINEIINE